MFLCNLLIINHKDTKNISFPQLFQSFSYTELTLILKKKKLINNTLENQKIIVQEDIASQSEHDKTSQIDRSFDRVWAMYGNPVGNKT